MCWGQHMPGWEEVLTPILGQGQHRVTLSRPEQGSREALKTCRSPEDGGLGAEGEAGALIYPK